jgi:putative transcriptional regulator
MLRNNLRILMAHRKIDNVSQLATIAGITARPLHNLYKENNVGSVKLETLLKICDGLHCSLNDLIEYTPDN